MFSCLIQSVIRSAWIIYQIISVTQSSQWCLACVCMCHSNPIQPITLRWYHWEHKSKISQWTRVTFGLTLTHPAVNWDYVCVVYRLVRLHPRTAPALCSRPIRTERGHRHPVPADCLVLHRHHHSHLWQQPLGGEKEERASSNQRHTGERGNMGQEREEQWQFKF